MANEKVKSGKSAGDRERRKLRDAAQALLSSPLTADREESAELKARGIKKPTEADALILGLLRRAERGEMDALKFLKELTGDARGDAKTESRKNAASRPAELAAMSDEELLALLGDG